MSKEAEFFIYLLERYASYKGEAAGRVLLTWDEKGLTEWIFDMYDIYHTERLENAFEDIDHMLMYGTPAW